MQRDGGVDIGREDGRQGGCIAEEHRDECQGRVEAAIDGVGKREVVVRPGNMGVLVGKRKVVGVGIVAIR